MDIEGDQFTIRQAVQKVLDLDRKDDEPLHKVSIAPPKINAGMRTIPLTEKLMDLFEKQRASQRLEGIKAGSAWPGRVPGKGSS